VGAGFTGFQGKDEFIIWLRRSSDKKGRVFLDRPALNQEKADLKDYLSLFKQREKIYAQQSHLQIKLSEGAYLPQELELIFQGKKIDLHASLTINPLWNLETVQYLQKIFNFQWLELRTDFIDDINTWLKYLEPTKTLVSHRIQMTEEFDHSDWALELGPPTKKHHIVSLHERKNFSLDQYFDFLESFSSKANILKASPEIHNFEELYQGHEWQQKDRHKRAILPRSNNGKWSWYRELRKGHMPLNFLRLDEGSSYDQPTILDWIGSIYKAQSFAAVIGDPIDHSISPSFHHEFFKNYQMPFLRIPVAKEEFFEALPILQKLGLRACAVTSPLKNLAYQFAKQNFDYENEWQSINTIFFKDSQHSYFQNTDIHGLKSLVEKIEGACGIWGGGAIGKQILNLIPTANMYSARSGKILEKNTSQEITQLIWACGDHPSYKNPPSDWPLVKMMDISYTENSMGKCLAQNLGIEYKNGMEMFQLQAIQQQLFWRQYLDQ
jgi:hypothetical protein